MDIDRYAATLDRFQSSGEVLRGGMLLTVSKAGTLLLNGRHPAEVRAAQRVREAVPMFELHDVKIQVCYPEHADYLNTCTMTVSASGVAAGTEVTVWVKMTCFEDRGQDSGVVGDDDEGEWVTAPDGRVLEAKDLSKEAVSVVEAVHAELMGGAAFAATQEAWLMHGFLV